MEVVFVLEVVNVCIDIFGMELVVFEIIVRLMVVFFEMNGEKRCILRIRCMLLSL